MEYQQFLDGQTPVVYQIGVSSTTGSLVIYLHRDVLPFLGQVVENGQLVLLPQREPYFYDGEIDLLCRAPELDRDGFLAWELVWLDFQYHGLTGINHGEARKVSRALINMFGQLNSIDHQEQALTTSRQNIMLQLFCFEGSGGGSICGYLSEPFLKTMQSHKEEALPSVVAAMEKFYKLMLPDESLVACHSFGVNLGGESGFLVKTDSRGSLLSTKYNARHILDSANTDSSIQQLLQLIGFAAICDTLRAVQK